MWYSSGSFAAASAGLAVVGVDLLAAFLVGVGLPAWWLGYLALLVVVPVGSVFYRAFQHGFTAAWDAVTMPASHGPQPSARTRHDDRRCRSAYATWLRTSFAIA